jgi:hypothetical protein
MSSEPTTRQLQRQLTAAESLCQAQAEKIRRQKQEIERLKRRIDGLLTLIDSRPFEIAGEGHG